MGLLALFLTLATKSHDPFNLESQWRTLSFFGLIYDIFPKKFELFGPWLLKKRVKQG